jgi:transposase
VRRLAVLFYNTVRCGMEYAEHGALCNQERNRQHVIGNLEHAAKAFGFVLQPSAGDPAAVDVPRGIYNLAGNTDGDQTS